MTTIRHTDNELAVEYYSAAHEWPGGVIRHSDDVTPDWRSRIRAAYDAGFSGDPAPAEDRGLQSVWERGLREREQLATGGFVQVRTGWAQFELVTSEHTLLA